MKLAYSNKSSIVRASERKRLEALALASKQIEEVAHTVVSSLLIGDTKSRKSKREGTKARVDTTMDAILEAGANAFKSGLDLWKHNPYPRTSIYWIDWRAGYMKEAKMGYWSRE